MEFRTYVKELGIDEIIEDLKLFEKQANDNQKEAIHTMIVTYENAVNGYENYRELEKILSFSVDERFRHNEKIDNVIRKHALVSMIILLELNRHGKGSIKSWLESVVVSTKAIIDGQEIEESTTFNINSEEVSNSDIEIRQVDIDFDEDFLDIPLVNRLSAKKWLEDNAPNNPKWSGYIGKKSLVEQLEDINSFDKSVEIQTFTNISDTRRKMKVLNTYISKRFKDVIDGYRENLGLKPILRKATSFGADEVAYFTELLDNDNQDIIASTGKELTIDYFADSLFYHLVKDDNEFTEKAKSFMLTVFITECKHILTDKDDRYILTYHYELKEE